MAFNLTITTSDTRPILHVLDHLSRSNLSPMFRQIGEELTESTKQRFVNQHDVEGNPWKQSWRAKLQGGQTLRDTGRLMNSISHRVLTNGVEVGTNVDYAAPLQLGATILPKTARYLIFSVAGQFRKVKQVELPARPFLGINTHDKESILNIIGRHLSV